MKLSTTLVVFALDIISHVAAREFTWLLSTSYNRTENWSKGRLPCSTDTVVFSKYMKMSLELPEGQLSMKEIFLPINGEIIFSKHGSISISSQNKIDGFCDGDVNTWLRDYPGMWLDPNSWSGASPACPDLERVPCPTDSVVFPAGSTFAVVLPPFQLPVSSVTVKGTTMVGEDLDRFLLSPEGERQFIGGGLTGSGEDCNDIAGCECAAELLNNWICVNQFCPVPECLKPVQPLGDCCPRCGAYLVYKFSAGTKLSEIENIVKRELTSEDVYWHVGRTMGYIQVVIVEKEYSAVSEELANKLDHILLTSRRGLNKFRVEASGPAVHPGGPGMSVLLFFLSMLITVALFTFFVVYFERGMPAIVQLFSGSAEGRFDFARFENQSGALELGKAAVPSSEPDESGTREFSNPMYSEGQEITLKRKIDSKSLEKVEDQHCSSEDTSLSDAETDLLNRVAGLKNMEEITTIPLLN